MLRIGITLGLRSANESMWVNGIKQTVIYFSKMLQASPQKHKVTLLNVSENIPITNDLPWDLKEYPTTQYSQGKDDLDVLFVMGGVITQAWLDELKSRGTKVVSFRLGSEYFVSMERIIFNQITTDARPEFLEGFDQMWFIPQVWEVNSPYLQVLHKLDESQIKKVPFFWDPMFIEEYLKDFENKGEYRPVSGRRRLSCFEPNINVVKSFIYPLLIAEMAYRKQADSIDFISILGSQHFRTNEEFLGVLEHLTIANPKGKCYFEDRHITPGFLALHTDIVISHQMYNPLNNLTLEVGWLGYPLIHNSPLCRNIGYYYEGFDVKQGAEQLVRAINHFDEDWVGHRQENRSEISQYLPLNPDLIAAYDDLLDSLFT